MANVNKIDPRENEGDPKFVKNEHYPEGVQYDKSGRHVLCYKERRHCFQCGAISIMHRYPTAPSLKRYIYRICCGCASKKWHHIQKHGYRH